jgi:hypothetical protein
MKICKECSKALPKNTYGSRFYHSECALKVRRRRTALKVIDWRRNTKRQAVKMLGGKCVRCGYSKCVRALHFHHKNPKTKQFMVSHPETKARKLVFLEVKKCILLCANCHAEEEDRIFRALN